MKTRHAEQNKPSYDNGVSAIRLFKFVEEAIERINKPPLAKKDIDINTDNYRELASDSDEDFIFAHIGVDFTQKNNELSFGMIFGKYGVGLTMGGQDYSYLYYEQIGDDEKDIAKKLVNILIALANGQIAILCTSTEDDDRTQAWEQLYRAPRKHLYDVLATFPVFESSKRLKNRQLVTEKFANTVDILDTSLDVDTLASFYSDDSGWTMKYNRKQIASLYIPLSLEAWERNITKYYENKSDDWLARYDSATNPKNYTLWGQMIRFAKWRHLELLWYSFAMMAYDNLIKLSIANVHPAMYLCLVFIIIITIFRNKLSYRMFVLLTAPLAYCALAISGSIFIQAFDNSFWAWVLVVLVLTSILENIVFDLRSIFINFIFKSMKGRDHSKEKIPKKSSGESNLSLCEFYFYFSQSKKENAQRLAVELESDGFKIKIHMLPKDINPDREWSLIADKDIEISNFSIIHQLDDQFEIKARKYEGSFDGHDISA